MSKRREIYAESADFKGSLWKTYLYCQWMLNFSGCMEVVPMKSTTMEAVDAQRNIF